MYGIWSKSLYSVVKERLLNQVQEAKRAALEHLRTEVSRKFLALKERKTHKVNFVDQQSKLAPRNTKIPWIPSGFAAQGSLGAIPAPDGAKLVDRSRFGA